MADSRYKYSYPLVLTPLRSDIEVDFANDMEASNAIDNAIVEYNKSASASRICPKELIDVKKHKRQISATLIATDAIRSPGRAVRTLSLKLLEYEYFQKLITSEHKLFTTIYDVFDEENQEVLEKVDFSDNVLLKCVVDVIFSSSKNIVMSSALQDFKNICIKYHLEEKYK